MAGSYVRDPNVGYAPRAAAANAADAAAAATGGNPVDAAVSGALTDDLNEGRSSQRFGDDIPGVDTKGRGFVRKGNESFHTATGSPPAGYADGDGQFEEGDDDGRQCSVM